MAVPAAAAPIGAPGGGAPTTAASRADADQFVVQFWEHGPAVHAYLARRAGRQGADDIFGEVWLRAFRARATYDHRTPDPRPWLYGIARYTLRAYWQQQHRGRPPMYEALADPWDEADHRLDANRRLTELRHALARLPDDEREVLLLVAWERLSPTEAAEVIGIPPGTARSRLHRARRLVQGELAPCRPVPSAPSERESRP
jgi:RNA polymerase sigma factor (sigma-70 family)